MEKNSNTYCPNCGVAFDCKQNDVKNCFCNTIVVSKSTLDILKTKFNSCLCKACLLKFSQSSNTLKTILTLGFIILFFFTSPSQFAGPVGSGNSTAMYKDSSAFVAWATNCMVNRGWQNIADHSLGLVDAGLDEYGTLKAGDNPVVSLGDGGSAILTFANPITDGAGFDFAVFENGFSDSFLELAFVEVSSDGIHFVRFPATSNTNYGIQIGPFDQVGDASLLNNLAGKYRVYYGTPFDLNELKDSSGIDISSITHIKIVDVVGDILAPYARLDINHHPINDPYPTDFPNGGFDLDAVGVIHQKSVGVKETNASSLIHVFPNPCNEHINIIGNKEIGLINIYDTNGSIILSNLKIDSQLQINTSQIPSGVYIIKISTTHTISFKRIVISR